MPPEYVPTGRSAAPFSDAKRRTSSVRAAGAPRSAR